MLFMLEVENLIRNPQTNHFSFLEGNEEDIVTIFRSIHGGNVLCPLCLGDKS